ncbi:response regulator SirA [bacterium]|nr:response regulator SirA [bacterium]
MDHVIKRDGRIVPFTKLRIANAIFRAAVAVGERSRDEADRMAGQVMDQAARIPWAGEYPSVEEIQDVVEKILIENGKSQIGKAYILYRSERARKRTGRASHDPHKGDPIPWKKIWQVLNWAIDHNLHTVQSLNDRVRAGQFGSIVRESEDAYQLDIARAADAILARKGEIRVVIVAGPSSSGKTTTTIKLSGALAREGFRFVPFHVDHYFHDLDKHPKDEYGDYDYETPQALDLAMINDHLTRLLRGETVRVPKFDYKAGKRIDNDHEMKLAQNEILLIDSLHGLYGGMTGNIPNEKKFRLYIETLLQMRDPEGRYIRWADLRMLRRMTRDKDQRFVDPRFTVEHWRYVRDSELDHIVPFVNSVDIIINGSLPYELLVMKKRWLKPFREWAPDYAARADRRDASERVSRVLAIFETLADITDADETAIPDTALIREFIGGSAYRY